MSTALVTAPVHLAVSLEEVREHLRVDNTDEDVLIDTYIKAATEYAQAYSGRQFVTATYDMFLDYFPSVIHLPKAPSQSVTSITYIDINGSSQTLAASVYDTDFNTEPARIVEADSQSWPTIRGDINSVTVRFVAGYGTQEDVPNAAQVAIKILVGDMFENREAQIVGTSIVENRVVNRLLSSLPRLYEVA